MLFIIYKLVLKADTLKVCGRLLLKARMSMMYILIIEILNGYNE